ncbi:hypothetical protein [Mucilaginibacter sp. dw_454]|uniref:hypothetical protein n=1 Tax=Mucilaginibacter sp. dw_454 TaxID=2720079 RepID=UPI001BD2B48A|nr:hypothetical protein [Mucilaginibacter sp. dw_454]
MNTPYLNRVLIYLQQELPEIYREHITLTGEKLVVFIPGTTDFNKAYEILYQTIVSCINRVRNREIDLEFTIKSKVQERDFKVFK